MTSTRWNALISELPPGLSAIAAARKIGKSYLATRYHLARCGYLAADGRKQREPGSSANTKIDWSAVDWTMRDAHIAKANKLSREAVRQMRLRRERHAQPHHD